MDVITRDTCVITGSENMEELYSFKSFPVHQNTTDEPPSSDLLLDLTFDICVDSGEIQVRNLVPEEILYNAAHSRSVGSVWQNHHRSFAEFIRKFSPESVFEIGGGSGYIETAYNSDRNNAIKWVILDPNPDPSDECGAEYIIGFFDEEYELNDRYGAIVFSHLFEHIYKPSVFISHLADIMKTNKGKMIFSVPDMQTMLENKQSNTLNFEHNFFLAETYVDYLLGKNGFRIIEKEKYKEHSIFYATEWIGESSQISVRRALFDCNKRLFLEYIEDYKKFVDKVNTKIESIKDDRPIYLFGAHLFSQFLLNFGIIESAVSSIIDNDSKKQGRRLQGSGLICCSPNVLKNDADPIVILRAGTYQSEIKSDIIKNINSKTEFWE